MTSPIPAFSPAVGVSSTARRERRSSKIHGERLEEVCDRLGHHFSQANAHAKAVRYLSLGAVRASQVYSNASAAEALESALRHRDLAEEADRGSRALELVFRLAFTYYLLGRFRDGLELLQAQAARVDEVADVPLQPGRVRGGPALCRRSLHRSPDPLNSACSTGWLGFAHRENGDHAEAVTPLEQAMTALRAWAHR